MVKSVVRPVKDIDVRMKIKAKNGRIDSIRIAASELQRLSGRQVAGSTGGYPAGDGRGVFQDQQLYVTSMNDDGLLLSAVGRAPVGGDDVVGRTALVELIPGSPGLSKLRIPAGALPAVDKVDGQIFVARVNDKWVSLVQTASDIVVPEGREVPRPAKITTSNGQISRIQLAGSRRRLCSPS